MKFDVVALLLGLEKIEGCAVTKTSAHIKWVDAENNSPLGNVQDGLKLELTFDGLDGKMLLPSSGVISWGFRVQRGLVLLRFSVSTSLTFFVFCFSTRHRRPPRFSLRPPSRPLLLRHPQLPIVENRDICLCSSLHAENPVINVPSRPL